MNSKSEIIDYNLNSYNRYLGINSTDIISYDSLTNESEESSQSQFFIVNSKFHECAYLIIRDGTGSLCTSEEIYSRFNIEHFIREDVEIVSTKAQIDYLRKIMGLNMSEIASIMNVSRQSVYDWIDDASKLRNENQKRLDIILEICSAWRKKGVGSLGSYLYKKTNNEKVPLLELLQNKKIDKKYILQVLDKIENVITTRKKNLEAHQAILKDHGFDEVSEEKINQNIDSITRKIG